MEQIIVTFTILIGGVFLGLYLISYRRLLNVLKNDYPEKWKQVGEPGFFDDSDARDIKSFLKFLESANDVKDTDLIKMKSKTKSFLIIGVLLIGGPLLYWIIRFLILFVSTPQ